MKQGLCTTGQVCLQASAYVVAAVGVALQQLAWEHNKRQVRCNPLHTPTWYRGTPRRATGRPAEAQQENTEATDADLLRKANPFLAKLLSTHLAGDKAAQGIAGAAGGAGGGAGEFPPLVLNVLQGDTLDGSRLAICSHSTPQLIFPSC